LNENYKFKKYFFKGKRLFIRIFSGDGYSYHDVKWRHFTVEFFLHSKRDIKIQKYLIRLLRKLKLNVILYKDKRYECNRIRTYSKQFFEFINNYHGKPDKEFKVGFISGMIDAEGSVSLKKSYITVVNTDKELLLKLRSYLYDLGINSTMSTKKQQNKNWSDLYLLNISNAFISIKNNSLKVNSGAIP
jgi:hypothetical protein